MDGQSRPTRIITERRLRERVPYSHAHLYRLEEKGLFPKRIKLGRHRVGWVEEEIEAWLKARMAERDADDAQPEGEAPPHPVLQS